MSKLGMVLWDRFTLGDRRISVFESFQSDPHTYVKVVVNDGDHDIVVQAITDYPFFQGNENTALGFAIQAALEKAADVIIDRGAY